MTTLRTIQISGFVEVCVEGAYRPICDTAQLTDSDRVFSVICSQLGYDGW